MKVFYIKNFHFKSLIRLKSLNGIETKIIIIVLNFYGKK